MKEPADDEEAALKGVEVRDVLAAANEDVEHVRLGGDGRRAQRRVVRRHLSPAQQVLSVFLHDVLKEPHRFLLRSLVLRGEDQAHAVVVRRRQADALVRADVGEEVVGHLDEDAGAVACVHLAATGAAVLEMFERRDAIIDDLVRPLPLEVYEKADAAALVLAGWIVESGRLRSFSAVCSNGYTGGVVS